MEKTIIGTIHNPSDPASLSSLMTAYSSAKRFAYNRFLESPDINQVRSLTTQKYPALNSRYMKDAVQEAKQLHSRFKNQKVIFGSRKLWNDRASNKISNEDWKLARDGYLYSRGDKTKTGNPNLRLVPQSDGRLLLRISSGEARTWLWAEVWLPKKHITSVISLLISGDPYSVRLIQKKHQTEIHVSWKEQTPETQYFLKNGAIGVDLNPNVVSWAFVSPDGNLMESGSIQNNRINSAQWGKRHHDIWEIAGEIVSLAIQRNCGIVLEDLKFNGNKSREKSYNKKRNRILGSFTWKQLLLAIEAKAVRCGVEVKRVNPAFTSIIGRLKYMVDIPVHEAAALCVARRGLGYKERVPDWLRVLFTGTEQEDSGKKSSWKIWSDLKKLTVPSRRAWVPRRVPRRGVAPPLGLRGVDRRSPPSPELLGVLGTSGTHSIPSLQGT